MALKALLISAAVVSVAVAVKLSAPSMLNFAVSDLPAIWSVILSWLKPPYLYVVLNGIIITIAASSRFHHHYHHHENQSPPLVNPADAPSPSDLPSVPIQPSFAVLENPALEVVYEELPVVYETESQPPVIDVETVQMNDSEVSRVEDEDEFVISRSAWSPPPRIMNSPPPPDKIQPDFVFPAREKPLVTSRFSHHRKPSKTSAEGMKALRVAKPRKHETLESTWKMITDGRHMPLTRHLRKSDSFENHHHAEANDKVVEKLETFDDRTHDSSQTHRVPADPSQRISSPASGGRPRKEGSLSHDELNRRVEAFIKKFNDEMRLQRQESLKRYMEMMSVGPTR